MYAVLKYRPKKIVINDYFQTSQIGPGYHLMLTDVLTIKLKYHIFHLVVAAIKIAKITILACQVQCGSNT